MRSRNYWMLVITICVSSSVFAINLPRPNYKVHILSEAVQFTLKHNPQALQSRENKWAAKEQITEAASAFMPQLSARYAAGKEKSYTYNNTLNRTDKSINLVQPIFSGFSSYNLYRQRKADFQAAKYSESAVKEGLALQAIQAYLEIRRLNKLYTATLNNVYSHRQILKKVQMKFHAGAGQKTEVDLALGRIAQRRSFLRGVNGALSDARTAFMQTVGFAPGYLEPVKLPAIPKTLHNALAVSLRYSPALKSADEQFRASNSALNSSKGSLLPNVNVEVSKSSIRNAGGIKGTNSNDRAMLVVNYNLFQGGSRFATISKYAHLRQAALFKYAVVRRAVIADVKNAWTDMKTDKKQLRDTRNHYYASLQVLKGYKEQFTLGKRSLLNLLDMENEVFTSLTILLNEKYAVKYDSYRLLAAMGMLKQRFVG